MLANAQDQYEQLKNQYDRLRKENKQDSSLIIAKQMNAWALKNETDTSLRYAVSLRYVGNCFNSLKNIDSAKFYFDFSLKTFITQKRGKSINAIRCFHNIGIIYYNLKDYEKTDSLWTIVLDLNRQLDNKSDDFRDALNNLVALNNDWGRYDQSEKYMLELLGSAKVKYGEESPEYANRLNQLGDIYKDSKNYALAEKNYYEALKIRETVLPKDHTDFISNLANLGYVFLMIDKHDNAISYFEESLRISEKNYGFSSKKNLIIIGNLIISSTIKKNYELTNTYFIKKLDLLKQIFGPEDTIYANCWMEYGFYMETENKFKEAKLAYLMTLNIRKKILGEFDDTYLQCLLILSELHRKTAEFKLAEIYIEKLLSIRKEKFGIEHPKYASAKEELGLILLGKGEDILADSIFTDLSVFYENYYGKKSIAFANIIYVLGSIKISLCDFKNAEQLLLKSLKIYEVNNAKMDVNYPKVLNSLGNLYLELGDFKASESNYKLALEIQDKRDPADELLTATMVNNLGCLYKEKKDYQLAKKYFERALIINEKHLGSLHQNVAANLNNLATILSEENNIDSAIVLTKMAIRIIENKLGKLNVNYADYLGNLADYYFGLKDYDSSNFYYVRTNESYKSILGNESNNYHENENDYAMSLNKSNRASESFEILNKNFTKKANQIADNFEWLNDNQKEAYWKKESEFFDNLSWFANEAYQKVPKAVGLNYNAVLVTKSKMLEAKISSENYYRDVDELREELAYRRRLQAKMESDGSTEKQKLEKLRHEADSLDKRLTLSWPEYAQQKKNLSITWDQVQQNLDKGEVAIEFVRFKNEDDSLYYYNALVIKKGAINPILLKLCKEKELQDITPKMGYSAYYPLVWKPLEAALKDMKTIYYAPTGELYNIPFHAIYSAKGKGDEIVSAKANKRTVVIDAEHANSEQNAEYLMDRYTMHQLTSTRYLAMGLKQKAKETIGNTMAMLGGINYDYLPGSTAVTKKKNKDKSANRSSASTASKLIYLEGTKTEVEQINRYVREALWQTKIIENNEATEENIIKMEGKEAKGILHLATHGYAFPNYDFADSTISKNSLRYSYRYSINPMVRSGLILAGGNWAWLGSDTLSKLGAEQNGILTALEVSQLNLKKTKLVVLSACETGLGKIEGSEGTFGLKRGFKLAGVEQMIVSLWSVPDKETMELMTIFYSDLTKTLNPISSFEKAQKEMRNKYPTEPEKWAGFVLVR